MAKHDRDDVSDIINYYKINDEEKRLENHQLEFFLTLRLFNKYLPPKGNVLEIGAGSGRYTLELAKQGYNVTATDISEHLLQINESCISESGFSKNVSFLTCDAREIGKKFAGKNYDAILTMGPMYHLVDSNDRKSLMVQIKSLLNKNGVHLCAHATKHGFLATLLLKQPELIEDTEACGLNDVMNIGHIRHHPRNGSFRGYFSNIDGIKKLYKESGLKLKAIHAQDPLVSPVDEMFNRLTPQLKFKWADYLTEKSSDVELLGTARHLLVVSEN